MWCVMESKASLYRPGGFRRIRSASACHPRIAADVPNETWSARSFRVDGNSSGRFRLRGRFHPQRSLGLANVFVRRAETDRIRSIENQIQNPPALLQRVRRLRDETNAHGGLLSRPVATARNFRDCK